MKKIFLITDYSDTIEKQINTFNLVTDIKKNGYDVCIASHVKLPDFIINEVDYYFYDKNNDLLYDNDIIEPNYFFSESLNIKYKPLFTISTHYIAIMRLFLSGLSLIKNLDYDIVHLLEYDNIIKNFNFIKKIEKKLENYDVIGGLDRHFNNSEDNLMWLQGNYFVFNLKNFEHKDFLFDRDFLLKTFRENYNKFSEYSGERTTYDILFKDKKTMTFEMVEIEKNIQLNLSTKNGSRLDIQNTIILFQNGDNLHYLVNNLKNDVSQNISFIINDQELIKINIEPNIWLLNILKPYNEINSLEINVNNKFYKKIDFNNLNDLELIKNNILI